jgi:hypothetical protein
MFEFRDPNSVPPEKGLDPSGFVVAVFKPHDLGRRAAFLGEVQRIGIGPHDRKRVNPGGIPNRFVRRKPGETRIEMAFRYQMARTG